MALLESILIAEQHSKKGANPCTEKPSLETYRPLGYSGITKTHVYKL